MKIPLYWAKSTQAAVAPAGRRFQLVSWQWSDSSVDEAQQRADAHVDAVAAKVRAGMDLNRYGYTERALREEPMPDLTDQLGSDEAVVTRNLYGALVLNAAQVMFIDVDFARSDGGLSLGGRLLRRLGVRQLTEEQRQVQRLSEWASRYPDLGVRIYRTFAGLRCLVTNQLFDPGHRSTTALLTEAGSDPLYVRLCQIQACFRARLTPKPWRVGLAAPQSRYPYEGLGPEQHHRNWVRRYESASAGYAVCRLITRLGRAEVHPEVEPVLRFHDRMACSDSAPLA